MSNEKQLFIKTTDSQTAKRLSEMGFQFISQSDNLWVFLNEPGKINFEQFDLKKIVYSNILSI